MPEFDTATTAPEGNTSHSSETNDDSSDQIPSKQSTESDDESWDGESNRDATHGKDRRMVSFGGSVLFGEDLEETEAPDDIPKTIVKPSRLLGMVFGCAKWSKQRLQSTALGLVSSVAVLTVRLILDSEPTAYLIHSIVVFLDMALIHLCTHSMWLSVSGELVTIAMVIAFHFTKQTVWELLETTLLAILCSFHLINSRNKHLDNEKNLRQDLNTLYRHTSEYIAASVRLEDEESAIFNEKERRSALIRRRSSRRALENMRSSMVDWNSDRSVGFESTHFDHLEEQENGMCKQRSEKVKVWGEQFFEHFLDGSAGVMYTSFFGLILDELIRINDPSSCK